jgi:hypothetical protein
MTVIPGPSDARSPKSIATILAKDAERVLFDSRLWIPGSAFGRLE